MIGSAYIHIPHGRRPLRVTAFRQSRALQLVRLDASHAPDKLSRMWWFSKIELRPDVGKPAVARIPGLTPSNYWLSVLVFSNAGGGWFQSRICKGGSLRVPEPELSFDDYPGPDAVAGCGRQGLALCVMHDDVEHDPIAKEILAKKG